MLYKIGVLAVYLYRDRSIETHLVLSAHRNSGSDCQWWLFHVTLKCQGNLNMCLVGRKDEKGDKWRGKMEEIFFSSRIGKERGKGGHFSLGPTIFHPPKKNKMT